MGGRLPSLLFVLGSLLTIGISMVAHAAEPQPNSPSIKTVDVNWGVKIPMRDGVNLNATVYRPYHEPKPLPVIFTLTPYISDTYHERGMYFARNGYVFVAVDSRGRGNSDGEFVPFINEGRDGYDTVEWLARQPWSNGKIAMWGGSYSGYNQWTTAAQFPPHLATIVPAASAYPGKNVPMVNNIHDQYWIQYFLLVAGKTSNPNVSEDWTFWGENFRESFLNHLPFEDLDRLAGLSPPVFHQWLQHPALDSYWEQMVPSSDQYKNIRIPILTITGQYDRAQTGALAFYFEHMQHGNPASTAKHYLVIGPWNHAGTRTARRDFAGWTFGENSVVDLNKLNKEWYDWTLKGAVRPEFLKNRVAYYLTGAEEWKYTDSLSRTSPSQRALYLHPAGSGATAGPLNEQRPMADPPERYTYDPLDTQAARLENNKVNLGFWPGHFFSIVAPSVPPNVLGNGLVYETMPFADDVEISGFPKLTVWMALDTPDTDFQVVLYEVLPDGRSIILSVDRMRARYRDSLSRETLVNPGEIDAYEFGGFTFVARRVSKGSRLRIALISPNSIFSEKNYNAGGLVTHESGKDSRTVHVTLYHDADRPSRVDLPHLETGGASPPPGKNRP
jgi:uncharacterized protein